MHATATDAGMSFREYGTGVLRERLEKMLAHVDAVREGADVEAVHDMRVASRRLRAAIAVFGPVFTGRPFAGFARDVKRVTRALGTARDLDVMIMTLEGLAQQARPEQRAGVEALAERKRAERRRAQVDVERALDRLERRKLDARFEEIAARPGKPARDARADEPAASHAAPAIGARTADLLAWEPHLDDSRRVVELHQTRIAAKRLRYTVEVFAPLFGEALTPSVEMVKRFQELLGSIHDLDVLVPELAREARRGLRPAVRNAAELGAYAADWEALAGLLKLCRRKQRERDTLHRRFVTEWRKVRAAGAFESLSRLAGGAASPAPAPDAAPGVSARPGEAAMPAKETRPSEADAQADETRLCEGAALDGERGSSDAVVPEVPDGI